MTDIWPNVKILASMMLEDRLYVTMTCKGLLAGGLDVRGQIILVFILKFAILLNGSKKR